MKTYLLLILISFSGNLFAYPNVGDRVEWRGVAQIQNQSPQPLVISKEIIAFDPRQSLWSVQYKVTLGAKTESKVLEERDLYTPAHFKKVLATCADQGGILEDLETTVGSYKTCKLTAKLSDGTLVEKWWGDIPFGVVSKNTRSPAGNDKLPIDMASY
ncbi:MAG: hypothetical protein HUU57_07240 [Bdellovibrio sp.]|nr:hypothetical protein [Bdellovibrio sp.]